MGHRMEKQLRQLTAGDYAAVVAEYDAVFRLYQAMVELQDACESRSLGDLANMASRFAAELERRIPTVRARHSRLCDAKVIVEGRVQQQELLPY